MNCWREQNSPLEKGGGAAGARVVCRCWKAEGMRSCEELISVFVEVRCEI
jgi:hypothetical protein